MPSTQKVVVIAGVALAAYAVVAIFQSYVMPVPVVGRFLPRAA